MASLPFTITLVIGAFAPLFSKRVFALAKLLLGLCQLSRHRDGTGNVDHSALCHAAAIMLIN
jgi:hypothetical protein